MRFACAAPTGAARNALSSTRFNWRCYLDAWHPAVRYDNAHGFCHRDTLHPDGTQEKTPVASGGANETFTFAIDELRTTWEAHRARFLREAKS